MPLKNIESLHPDLIPLANEFLSLCDKNHLKVIITCSYRSNKEQNDLYAQGRETNGNIVTNAKAGQSEHNFEINGAPASKAFDIVPIRNGVAIWDLKSKEWEMIYEIWKTMKTINGFWLDWYGKPGSKFKEGCHFCLRSC